jgi:tRNA (guanine26-N2/guanine27-N2)-dimethyltransferase
MHPLANPSSKRMKLVRFQENPQENWGPKAKAVTAQRPHSSTNKPMIEPKKKLKKEQVKTN